MFAKSLALALLSVVIAAAPRKMRRSDGTGGRNQQRAYLQFLSQMNKFPSDTAEFERREHNFEDAIDAINAINLEAEQKRLKGAIEPNTAAINWTADLDREEYLGLLGLTPFADEISRSAVQLEEDADDNGRRGAPANDGGRGSGTSSGRSTGTGGRGRRSDITRGRGLIADALTIDWFAAGMTTGVKDQQSCGSCWAFTANTVSETTLAIKSGKAPIRLSEQQLVDCTTNTSDNKEKFGKQYKTYGCGGGWMAYGWQFQKE